MLINLKQYEFNREKKEPSVFTKQYNKSFLSTNKLKEMNEQHPEYEMINYGLLYRPKDLKDEYFDLTDFSFLDDSVHAPDSVNPSLFAMARANLNPGVYSVVGKDIIQVRGLVVGNITFVRGKTGWIVLDCLYDSEAGKKALMLVEKCLNENIKENIKAAIFTYAVTDVYGNIKGGLHGIIPENMIDKIQVYAPKNVGKQFTLENVYTNVVNMRRQAFQFGAGEKPGEKEYVTLALGIGSKSFGKMEVQNYNHAIEQDGWFTVDGLRIYAQLVSDVGAPPELNLYFKEYRALWGGEFLCGTLHNIYPLRGSKVRDANKWSKYITELYDKFGDQTDVIFQNVNWPHVNTKKWPTAVKDYLLKTATAYKYIHDQVLHQASGGKRIEEIAKELKYPEGISGFLANRPFYGSIEAGVRGVYTQWLGSYDGNPMYIKGQTKAERAEQFIEYVGSQDLVFDKALQDFELGKYQRAIEALDQILFVNPNNEKAKLLEADGFEQLAYQSENGTLRNAYLAAASELRFGISVGIPEKDLEDKENFVTLAQTMPVELTLDYLGISLLPEKVENEDITFQWIVQKEQEEYWIIHIYKGAILYSQKKKENLPYIKSKPGMLMAFPKRRDDIVNKYLETDTPELIDVLWNSTDNLLEHINYSILWKGM